MDKIKLVLGSNFYDLKKAVISKIEEKSDWENLVIVPDRFSLLAEQLIFKELKINCVFNTRVMPVTQFANYLLSKINVNYEVISSKEQSFLIRRAIEKTKNKFTCFSQNLSLSYCDQISKTISQLKSCKISPQNFQKAQLNVKYKDKLNDLQLIYEEYENLLNNQFDGSKMLDEFQNKIVQMDLKNVDLYFIGFEAFTPQIFEIIKTLQSGVNKIVIGAFYHFNQPNKKIYETDIFEKFKNLNVEFEYVNNSINENQKIIMKNLFSNNKKEKTISDFVSIYSASSKKQEIEFVCEDILEKIKNHKMRFCDFAIADSNLQESADEYENILKLQNINYYLDTMQNFIDTTFAQFILNYFLMVLSFFDKTNLKNFLSSNFCHNNLITKSKSISFVEKYNIEKQSFFNIKNEFIKDENLEFKAIRQKVLKLYSQLKTCERCEDYVNFTKKLAEDFDCEKKLEDDIFLLQKKGDIKQEKVHAQLFDKFLQCLLSIEKYLPNEKLTTREYFEILESVFSQKKISTVPISSDCVFVGDVSESFFDDVKVLYVIGAESENLPKVLGDFGLINDENISELKSVIEISPTVRMINRRNKFKLLNLLSLPSEKLNVLFQKTNIEGKENLPSSFVLELQSLFGSKESDLLILPVKREEKIYIDSYQNQIKQACQEINTPQKLKEFFFKNAKSERFDRRLINSVFEILKESNQISSSELNLFFQNQDMPKINNAKKLFFKTDKTKISQIEIYYDSPFKHFLYHGLKLKNKETGEIEKTDIGNFMHYIAQAFIQKIKPEKEEKINIDEILRSIIKNALKTQDFYKFSISVQNEIFLRYLTIEAKKMCEAILNQMQKSLFNPTQTEKAFQIENYFEKQKMTLVGRVDRIDEYENYFIILDYKTGVAMFDAKAVYTGKKLQLLIYADAQERLLSKKCAGVFYFPVKSGFESQIQSKLSGTFLREKNIIFALDKTLGKDKLNSEIIKANIKVSKDDTIEFYSNTGTDVLEQMIRYAKLVSENAIEQIIEGHIEQVKDEKYTEIFENPIYKKLEVENFDVKDEIFQKVTESEN